MSDYTELAKKLRSFAIIEDSDYENGGCTGYDMIMQAADAIEELQETLWKAMSDNTDLLVQLPKWIPVTERLPGYGDWVLGIGPKHGYHICEYRGITHFPYSGDSPWFSAKGRSLNITHWMPLPQPPKEET